MTPLSMLNPSPGSLIALADLWTADAMAFLAATALDLLKSSSAFTHEEWICLLVGALLSFVVAIVSIRFFLAFIKRFTLAAFGYYRVLAAVILWYFV